MVKFGITRSNFLIGTTIFYIFISALMAIIISIFVRFEVWFNYLLYSRNATLEASFKELIIGKGLILFLGGIVILAIGMIVAPIVYKFGAKGLIAIYIAFLFIPTAIIPNIMKAYEQKNLQITINFLEPIGNFLNKISTLGWVSITSTVVLIALAASLYSLLRQDIKS